MKCKRCLNEDPEWFYLGSKGWYCRKCISFGRILIEEDLEAEHALEIQDSAEEYTLKYPLTKQQVKIAAEVIKNIKTKDVLVKAVCGAGKTEIVVPVISEYLSKKKKVCFTIPRRQVVLEVAERLQSYFKNAKVVAVCGGHTQVLDGDLIICTAHQLYRYYQRFDLLILDESDAFPYHGNELLHSIALTSCRGNIVYLTATPDNELINRCEEGSLICLELNVRPHGKPMPVPKSFVLPELICIFVMLYWLKCHDNHPRIVFVSTIKKAVWVGKLICLFMPAYVCTSKTENRDEVIEKFRVEGNGIMVSTTVLERGVTFPHTDVCVLDANSGVFDEASLIQMAGRAGRDFQDPTGNVLFLCNEMSEVVKKCISSIRKANESCIV